MLKQSRKQSPQGTNKPHKKLQSLFSIERIGIALAAFEPELESFELQLKTIQDQSFREWVCVITLDSPLRGLRSEASLEKFFQDARFIWLENKHRLGHKKNFEYAIQEVVKLPVDALACADQDDFWYQDKLEKSKKKLEETGPMSLVHSDMHLIDAQNQIREVSVWQMERRGIYQSKPKHFLIRNTVAGCSLLMDAELARLFPNIPQEAEFHDHWYALIASSFGGVHPLSESLYAYRQHENNVVGISPFNGIFFIKDALGLKMLFRKCTKGFEKSRNLALAFENEGGQLNLADRLRFIYFLDFGLGVLLLGLRNILSDPALTRACLARAFGKLLKTWSH